MANVRDYRGQLGSLADDLLKEHLRSMDEFRQNQFLMGRQSALANQQAANATLEKIMQNPSALSKYMKDHPNANVGGVSLSPLVPNQQDAVDAIGANLAKAKTLEELPPDAALYAQAKAQPGADTATGPLDITSLIAQRDAQRKAIQDALKMRTAATTQNQFVPVTNPDGSKSLVPANAATQQGPIVTGPTAQQEGTNEGVKEAAKLSAPGYTSARINDTNLFNRATAGSAAFHAGAIKDATTDYELKPQFDENGNPQAPVAFNPRSTGVKPVNIGPIQAIPGAASERQQAQKISNLHDTLDRIDTLLTLANKYDLTGPMGGRIADFMAGKVGTTGNPAADKLFGKLKLDMQSVPPQIALGLGEGARGAGSVQMLQNWKPLFSLNGPDVLKGAVEETRLLLPKKGPKTLNVAPGGKDPLGLFSPSKH